MKNSDFVLYYSQMWLDEVINSNGCKNEHELYTGLHCMTVALKIIK